MKFSESVIAVISSIAETPFSHLCISENYSAVGAQLHQGKEGYRDYPRRSRARKSRTEGARKACKREAKQGE